MDQNNTNLPKGHMKPFWPLMIIFVVASVAAGLIYWFQFNLSTDYDLQTIYFTVHKRPKTTTPTTKMPVKGAVQPTSTVPTGK